MSDLPDLIDGAKIITGPDGRRTVVATRVHAANEVLGLDPVRLLTDDEIDDLPPGLRPFLVRWWGQPGRMALAEGMAGLIQSRPWGDRRVNLRYYSSPGAAGGPSALYQALRDIESGEPLVTCSESKEIPARPA